MAVGMASRVRMMRFVLFLLVVAGWLQTGTVVASGYLCEEVCDGSTGCTEECFMTEIDFINGNPASCRVYGVYDYDVACCGDGICQTADEACSCEDDCGVCEQGCNECNAYTSAGCNSNQRCNASQCCIDVPVGWGPSPGKTPPCYSDYCYTDSQCCSGEMCWRPHPLGGAGTCVPKHT